MANEKVQKVNELLLAGEPENISVDEHSGYTGYKPQAVVDAMNEVFWGEWGFTEISSEVVAGDKSGLAVAQVKVWIKGVEFQPTGWGQNRVTRGDIGDARKGAQTDAIKKALSYFSIGNRAYHGLLPDKKEQAMAARQANNKQQAPVQPVRTNQPANGNARQPQPSKPAEQKPAQTSMPMTTPAPTALQPNAERPYLPFFNAGRDKGLWTDFAGFCTFATTELGEEVNRDNVRSLKPEQLARLDIAIKEEEPVKKAS